MKRDRWVQIEALFNRAVECEPDQRVQALDEAGITDPELRREVEALLSCHRSAGGHLRAAIREEAGVIGLSLGNEDGETAFITSTLDSSEAGSGSIIGPYHLLERIGEGGMGEVWLAEQKKPVRRRVALKLIKAGMNTREVVRRFESERQAVALMDHPTIAKVFDGGSTSLGHPYFAMEYVAGVPITAYCDRHKLTTRERLELFIHVCEGVQHAHQKAIIHRDLKPSNILVSEVDGKPIPRIIDFGVAKAISQPLTAETMFTRAGAVVGTPEYMSPEQADSGGEDIDTRTDVYSLGVVLYELLVGALPLVFQKLPFDEILRRLREQDAPKPSTKLRTLGAESSTTAQNRGTDPPTLARQLHGDLDAITLKALEKDRSRRYATPLELAADIARHLRHEPVAARPASTTYRARKYVRRHWSGVVFAGALVLGVLAASTALSGVAWFFLRTSRTPPTELTQKRLTSNSIENPVQNGAISPDGKYLAYSDASGIHVKLLSTGVERLVPKPVGVPADAGWAVRSWFPNGTQFLANVFTHASMSMWAVSMLGQSPRELRESAMGLEVSPDGSHIAFTPDPPGPMHEFEKADSQGDNPQMRKVEVADSRGDNPHKVLEAGKDQALMHVHWSPNGRRLIYSRVSLGSDRTTIETCDLNGTNRTVVTAEPDGSPYGGVWLRDGRVVYARQEVPQSSYSNLWQIHIDNRTSKPIGQPRRITQWADSNIGSLSSTADGTRVVVQKITSQSEVYIAELGAGAAHMRTPRLLTNSEAFEWPHAWTPDSKAVLFISDRNGPWSIFKQGITESTAEPVISVPQILGGPRFTADGEWLLLTEAGNDAAAPSRLMRVRAGGGAPQFVLETRSAIDFQCAHAPANICVILEPSEDEKQLIVSVLDPFKGRGKVLRTIQQETAPFRLADGLSPDGTTLAVTNPNESSLRIRLLSLSGGSDRQITVRSWRRAEGLDWSADGKAMYCGAFSPEGGNAFLRIDLAGNVSVLWQRTDRLISWGIPSPNGHHMAMRVFANSSNLWMLAGF